MIKKIAKQLSPPILTSAIRRALYNEKKENDSSNKYSPSWHKIKEGNLKGREIFVDPKDGYWQKELLRVIMINSFLNICLS